MVSYSSVNGVKMHANHDLVTNFLKGTLRFRGFVISDWKGIDKITSPPHSNYTHSVLAGVQASIDMAHRDLAREAVRKSLVLLKNGANVDDPMLPLPKNASRILVAGTHANNLGYQCGGWTMTTQGVEGNNFTLGTTILDAITDTVGANTEVVYSESPTTEFLKSNNFSFSIGVVGEPLYGETAGDNMNLTITKAGIDTMSNVCGSTKCVVVLISGRPLVVQPYLSNIDALVAAWLPGTEGQGVVDVLFGDYEFSGKLPTTWFKNVDHLPMNVADKDYDPLYPFGFGLTAFR